MAGWDKMANFKGRRQSNKVEDRRGGTSAYANSNLNRTKERKNEETWMRRSDVVSALAHQVGVGSMEKAMKSDRAETDSKKYRTTKSSKPKKGK